MNNLYRCAIIAAINLLSYLAALKTQENPIIKFFVKPFVYGILALESWNDMADYTSEVFDEDFSSLKVSIIDSLGKVCADLMGGGFS